jgi:hypothetical protein
MEAHKMPNKMTKRLAVYLPDGVYEFLEEWASEERRSTSNLAAVLLELMARDREGWLAKITERTQTETPTPTAISTKAKRNSRAAQQQDGNSDG